MKAFTAASLCASALLLSAVRAQDADSLPLDTEPLVEPEAPKSVERPDFVPSTGKAHFIEQFQQDVFARWSPSEATKQTPVGGETFSYVGKWDVREPDVYPGIKGDKGLVVTNAAAHHAISVPLNPPVDPAAGPLVVQYEVKLQKGLECGGAYIKLLSDSPDGIQAEEFSDKTPYTIMFGPDRCGATNKVHLILRHKNPITGDIEEKHLKNAPSPKITKTTALYTLILDPSNQSYEIKVNDESVKSGNILEDFDPPIQPSEEIDDPEDKKPEDWVENAKISDPDASKPDDWDEDAPLEIEDEEATIPDGWLVDEPATIPDPDAEKPEEWDDEEDGDWVAPVIPNPKCEEAPGCGPWSRPLKANPDYKGKWYAPLIDNPLYKGIWKAAKIANPAYFKDDTPLSGIGRVAGLGFEIWSMQSDILFDNIFIGSSASDAEAFAKTTFHVKEPVEKAAEEAEKPAPAKESVTGSLKDTFESFKKDPIGYVRTRLESFIDAALVDPVGAFKTHPQEGVVIGTLVATFIGMIGFLFGAVGAAPKPAVVKEKAAATAKKVQDKVAEVAPAIQEKANEAITTATETVQSGTDSVAKRTRGAKGKSTE